jgi:hypothetical protein
MLFRLLLLENGIISILLDASQSGFKKYLVDGSMWVAHIQIAYFSSVHLSANAI